MPSTENCMTAQHCPLLSSVSPACRVILVLFYLERKNYMVRL